VATTGVRSTAERVAVGFGAFYILLGIFGFFVTGLGGGTFFGEDSNQAILGLITLNGMHNVAHLGFGAVLVAAAAISAVTGREEVVRGGLIGLGAVYTVAAIVGFAGAFGPFLNIPAGMRGLPDNLFHVVSAAFLLIAGFSRASAAQRGEAGAAAA
jgi:hypothetical protein